MRKTTNRIVSIVCLMLLIGFVTNAQDTLVINTPFKVGKINSIQIYDSHRLDLSEPLTGVSIYLESSDTIYVESVVDGQVLAVDSLREGYVMIIKNKTGQDIFVVYSHLDCTFFKKGDFIKSTHTIGYILPSNGKALMRLDVLKGKTSLLKKENHTFPITIAL